MGQHIFYSRDRRTLFFLTIFGDPKNDVFPHQDNEVLGQLVF